MNFYIATNMENQEAHTEARRFLEKAGHRCTFDWTTRSFGITHPDALRAIAIHEIEAVRAADFVVVLLPGGFGTHVEMGAALGIGKPVYLVSDHGSPLTDTRNWPFPFYYHYGVRRVNDVAAILRHLDSDSKQKAPPDPPIQLKLFPLTPQSCT